MKMGFGIIIVLFLTVILCSCNRNEPASITGLYSNMCCNEQNGECNGMELFIVYATSGGGKDIKYYGIFQYCEGAAYPPVIVELKGICNTISFKLPFIKNKLDGVFTGTIEKDGIRGGIPHVTKPGSIWLKRQPSYWQKQRKC